MKLLAVANPAAGGGRAARLLPRFRRLLHDSPHRCEWIAPPSREELVDAVRRAGALGYEGVLLAGGDGTVHDALPALRDAGLPFGVLPCGRGNDFARNIGMPRSLEAGHLRAGALATFGLDLPEVNGTPFGSIACLGFDADVNRLARERLGYLGGTAGYVVCVLRALRAFRPFAAEVEIDGRTWRGDVMLIAVANGPCYGGGMRIAPGASMSDGLLDVCVVRRMSKGELVSQFLKVFRGAHVGHAGVSMARGRRVRVTTEGGRDIYADGELAGRAPAEWTIRPGALRVLVPGGEGTARA